MQASVAFSPVSRGALRSPEAAQTIPVHRGAGHDAGYGEIPPEALAGLELGRIDQRFAIGILARREPDQRAFILIDAHPPGRVPPPPSTP